MKGDLDSNTVLYNQQPKQKYWDMVKEYKKCDNGM
jgi:hypothetical protein